MVSAVPVWFRRATALLLMLVPLAFGVFYTQLQASFSYPEILDAAPEEVLRRYAAGGGALTATWYGYMAAALLLIPLVVLLHRVIASRAAPPYLPLATVIGVCAGMVQTLGLARWVFLVPSLAGVFTDPVASVASKDAAIVVFQAFNAYLGSGVGEHLGYLLTAIWTMLLCVALFQTHIAPRSMSLAGGLLALGILAGDAAFLGVGAAERINGISYLLWALWLIVLGVFVWRMRQPTPGEA